MSSSGAASIPTRTSPTSSSRSRRINSRAPCSRSARSPSPRSGPRRIDSACWSRRRQTARKSASCPMATTQPSSSQHAASVRTGAIVNQQGERLATHAGVHRFTVGQRKGLGIAAQIPLYVLKIDADSGDVTVGPRSALDRANFTVVRRELDRSRMPAASWLPATVQIRHRHRPAAGRVRAIDEWPRRVRARRAAARRHARTGRRLLRRRHRHWRRLDSVGVFGLRG